MTATEMQPVKVLASESMETGLTPTYIHNIMITIVQLRLKNFKISNFQTRAGKGDL